MCPTLATLWTVAYKALLSMKFSRQEYWSRLPFPLQGIFPTRGSNRGLAYCRQTLYRLSHQGSPNLDGILKSRDITLPTKMICLVKAMIIALWSRMDVRVGL